MNDPAIANLFESYTVNVSTADGSIPFGNVTFTLTGVLNETVTEPLTAGSATLPAVQYPNFGRETIAVSYAGNAAFKASNSSLVQDVRGTIYVDQNVSGGLQNGTSWQNAYPTVWQAIAAALPDDSIDVAQGNYSPAGSGFNTFILQFDLKFIGGFVTGGGDNIPNPALYTTSLEGDNTNSDVIAGNGLGSATLLDGFTIKNGHVTGDIFRRRGGSGRRQQPDV